jgi:rhodanese-related sulfurtransferase
MSYTINFSMELECIDKGELLDRINGKANFILVDTVGNYDGNRFRIRGARTIPYPDVIDRRQELLSFDEIIIYCKHSSCRASKKVALGLKLLNISNVKVYEGGIDEWVENGLPVEEE